MHPLAEQLTAMGYALHHRADGWHECLASREAERWIGRGADETAALEDLLRQLFPSGAAREALEAWRLANVAPVSAELPLAEVQPPVPVPVLAVVEEAAPSTPGQHDDDLDLEPSASRYEALDALADLSLTIEDSRCDLARMVPLRQRLYITGWICRARAFEESFPHDDEVEASVTATARRLGELCRQLWPGTVRPLQRYANPNDVLLSSRGAHATVLATWAAAADYIEVALRDHLRAALESGCDEDGWADARRLQPAPSRADDVLREVREQLDALIERDGHFPKRHPTLDASQAPQLIAVAQRLRWLRRATRDDVSWGEAIGRLRWLLPACPGARERLEDVVSAGYVPAGPWADVILGPELEARRRARIAEVATRVPCGPVDHEELVAWIREAVDVLGNPELAALLTPIRAEVGAAVERLRDGADRRMRRRLDGLVERLESIGEADAGALRHELTKGAAAAPSQLAPMSTGPRPDARAELVARVRPHTERRRAVLVSNRLDAALQAALEQELGLRVTPAEATPRRLRAVCERIRAGTYDLVLSATGFQDHSTDAALKRATRAANVPLVRVDRGRPLACVRALARELNIAAPSDNRVSTSAL